MRYYLPLSQILSQASIAHVREHRLRNGSCMPMPQHRPICRIAPPVRTAPRQRASSRNAAKTPKNVQAAKTRNLGEDSISIIRALTKRGGTLERKSYQICRHCGCLGGRLVSSGYRSYAGGRWERRHRRGLGTLRRAQGERGWVGSGLTGVGIPLCTAPLDSCLRRNDERWGPFDRLRANGGVLPHPNLPPEGEGI